MTAKTRNGVAMLNSCLKMQRGKEKNTNAYDDVEIFHCNCKRPRVYTLGYFLESSIVTQSQVTPILVPAASAYN